MTSTIPDEPDLYPANPTHAITDKMVTEADARIAKINRQQETNWKGIKESFAAQDWYTKGFKSWRDFAENTFLFLAQIAPGKRDKLILELTDEGMSTREIGQVMLIGKSTVQRRLAFLRPPAPTAPTPPPAPASAPTVPSGTHDDLETDADDDDAAADDDSVAADHPPLRDDRDNDDHIDAIVEPNPTADTPENRAAADDLLGRINFTKAAIIGYERIASSAGDFPDDMGPLLATAAAELAAEAQKLAYTLTNRVRYSWNTAKPEMTDVDAAVDAIDQVLNDTDTDTGDAPASSPNGPTPNTTGPTGADAAKPEIDFDGIANSIADALHHAANLSADAASAAIGAAGAGEPTTEPEAAGPADLEGDLNVQVPLDEGGPSVDPAETADAGRAVLEGTTFAVGSDGTAEVPPPAPVETLTAEIATGMHNAEDFNAAAVTTLADVTTPEPVPVPEPVQLPTRWEFQKQIEAQIEAEDARLEANPNLWNAEDSVLDQTTARRAMVDVMSREGVPPLLFRARELKWYKIESELDPKTGVKPPPKYEALVAGNEPGAYPIVWADMVITREKSTWIARLETFWAYAADTNPVSGGGTIGMVQDTTFKAKTLGAVQDLVEENMDTIWGWAFGDLTHLVDMETPYPEYRPND